MIEQASQNDPPLPHLTGEQSYSVPVKTNRFEGVPFIAWARLVAGIAMPAIVYFLFYRGQPFYSYFTWGVFGVAMLSLSARDFKKWSDDQKNGVGRKP